MERDRIDKLVEDVRQVAYDVHVYLESRTVVPNFSPSTPLHG